MDADEYECNRRFTSVFYVKVMQKKKQRKYVWNMKKFTNCRFLDKGNNSTMLQIHVAFRCNKSITVN